MEKLMIWLAWKLPRRLAKWAAVRVIVAGTPDDQSPEETLGAEALERWG